MKTFYLNDDWFAADAIASIHRDCFHSNHYLPFRIVITYKYNCNQVIYDYKTESERDIQFTTLVSRWQRACQD